MSTTEIFQYSDYFRYIQGLPNELTTYLQKIANELSKSCGKSISETDLTLSQVPQKEIDYHNIFEIRLKKSNAALKNARIKLSKYKIVVKD
jgi:hypothetical protein